MVYLSGPQNGTRVPFCIWQRLKHNFSVGTWKNYDVFDEIKIKDSDQEFGTNFLTIWLQCNIKFKIKQQFSFFFFTRLISRIRQNLFNYSVSKIKDPQQIFGMFWECMKPIKVMLTQFWLLLGTVWNLSKQGSPNFDWFWGTVWYQIPIKVRFTTRHTKFENEDFQHFEFFQIPNLEGHKAYQVRKWMFLAPSFVCVRIQDSWKIFVSFFGQTLM